MRHQLHDALRENHIHHAQVAARARQERSHVTRQLLGKRPLTLEVARAASELLAEADRRRLHWTAALLADRGQEQAAAACRALAVAV